MPDNRVHEVSAMTDSELERARRHLMVSLSLAFPGSPVRGPILAHISAIDAELAERASRRPRDQDAVAETALEPGAGVHHHPAHAGGARKMPGRKP
jgi:hypothetical protein